MSYKTFLQQVNELAREAGVTGNASALTTTANQSGEANRLVNWVKQAHNDVQNKHTNWRWMRSTFTVNTVASTDSYAPTACTDSRLAVTITRFAHWIPFDDQGAANIKIYLTSGGVGAERWLVNIPWSYFMSIYRRGTQNAGPPIHVTIDPQNNIVLGPKPDDIYTVSGEYQMSKLILVNDGDVPELPLAYEDVIWTKALEKYGRYHMAAEVLSRGQVEGGRILRELEINQLPEVTQGAPLA